MEVLTFTAVAGTERCNVRCPFCIAVMTKHFKPAKLNIINFKAAALLAHQGRAMTFLITGKGEPTLDPEQITEMLTLTEGMFASEEIQTNGLTVESGDLDEYLPVWRALGLKTIAISVVHWDAEKNKLMGGGVKETLKDLAATIKKVHSFDLIARVSVTMVKGYTDSVETMAEFIRWGKANGADQMTFRPVTKPDDGDNKVTNWVREHSVADALPMACLEYLRKVGTQVLTLPHGAVIFDVDGQNVCLTNCLTIDTTDGKIRQIIYHMDGHVRFGWQLGAILF